MLAFIWGGLGPNPTTQNSRNTGQNGCETNAPIPNYHSPYSPITQTNLRNQGQNAQCFHRESLLGSILATNIFFPQAHNIYTNQEDITTGTLSKITSNKTVRFHV
jgi:hypothetical protein